MRAAVVHGGTIQYVETTKGIRAAEMVSLRGEEQPVKSGITHVTATVPIPPKDAGAYVRATMPKAYMGTPGQWKAMKHLMGGILGGADSKARADRWQVRDEGEDQAVTCVVRVAKSDEAIILGRSGRGGVFVEKMVDRSGPNPGPRMAVDWVAKDTNEDDHAYFCRVAKAAKEADSAVAYRRGGGGAALGLRGPKAAAALRRWVLQRAPVWLQEEELRGTLESAGWTEISRASPPLRPRQGWICTGKPPGEGDVTVWALDLGTDRLAKIREWEARRADVASKRLQPAKAWLSGQDLEAAVSEDSGSEDERAEEGGAGEGKAGGGAAGSTRRSRLRVKGARRRPDAGAGRRMPPEEKMRPQKARPQALPAAPRMKTWAKAVTRARPRRSPKRRRSRTAPQRSSRSRRRPSSTTAKSRSPAHSAAPLWTTAAADTVDTGAWLPERHA